MAEEDGLTESLETVRGKRGYLLAHHGLMALSGDGLLEAYDALYTRLTLTPGHLSRHEHEFVWMAVLTSIDEPLGTHHIPRYLQAGGSREEFEAILALTALAKGIACYRFVERHWLPHLPPMEPEAAYRNAFERAAEVWRRLIADGEVEASAAFRAWASLAGQGGYDQASGIEA